MLSSCLSVIALVALLSATMLFIALCFGAAAMRRIDYPQFDPAESEEEV